MDTQNCQMPTFEELFKKAQERVEVKRVRAQEMNKFMNASDRYLICECGNAYGNEYIPMTDYETINNCPKCKEEI